MRRTGIWLGTSLSLILAATIVVGPGCASTKNVMNKATFGLVGDDSEDQAAKKEAKRQAEEEKKAEKQARKQEKEAAKAQDSEPKRGLMSKATFGLVGGGSEDKAEKKEAKRQAEEQKKAEKRAAKEEEKAQERAREEQKQAEKQARKDEKQMAEADRSDSAEKPERSLMSKATFGLVGDGSEEKAAKKEAKRQAEEQKKADKRAAKEEEKAQERAREEQKQAEKQARKEEKQMAEADRSDSEEKPVRGLMSKATFGLVGGGSEEKAEKKEAKRQAEEQEKAEKQARKQEKQMAKAESDSPEAPDSSDKPKRGLMSKLTFGLVGGDGGAGADQSVEQEMPASTPEPPVQMASAQSDYGVQPETEMSNEARRLAKLPFETGLSYDSLSASGKQQAVASRSTYSKHNYGITDLGDVRIAVRDMTFSGGTRGGHIIVSSEDRAKASGSAGIGNETFRFDYERGVTACTFGTIQFTIEMGVITIDGRSVPMGQGHKLVVVDAGGKVEGVYGIE